MRVRLNHIDLIGGGRRVDFTPGLNVVTGPISTGKTTFMRLCRALFGTGIRMGDFPREVRHNVAAVAGEVEIGQDRYSIVRPLVSTDTAKVDIAGSSNLWRLPADRPDSTSNLTYGRWLLGTMGLPELSVPSAPTRPDSESTPVSINDFFLYCRLTQNEIDNSVFAHSDPFKNIKRRYVFEIIYGIYDPEIAILQEEYRNVSTALRQLNLQTEAFQRFLDGTQLSNRAALLSELDETRKSIAELETESIEIASSAGRDSAIDLIHRQLRELDVARRAKTAELDRARESVSQFELLTRQLDSQVGKLTRSIVAGSYLNDLEFLNCPRCGTPVDINRAEAETCGLCLQVPHGRSLDRSILIAEQDRLVAQVEETRDLVKVRREAIAFTERELALLDVERARLLSEVNFHSRSFVSAHADEIAENAAQRARLQARVLQLEEYLVLLARLDQTLLDAKVLTERRQDLEAKLEAASMKTETAEGRIQYLESEFSTLIEQFKVPRLEGPDEVRIDRKTYLPILFGRHFSELSSQGLQVLVNVAHALAHHRTSIALELGLPQILLIDGLTSNLGHEGEDLERINAVYDYLIALSEELGDQFQVIVSDNDVPPQAEPYVRLRLQEDDRLIRPETQT